MYAFDATYNEEEAARSERAFLRRSARELRKFYYLSELVILLLLTSSLLFGGPTWATYALGALFLVPLLGEMFFYLARPAEARRLARRYPNRRIEFGSDALCVSAGGETTRVPWKRIGRIWTTDESVILVLSPFLSVSIPRAQLPAEAYERLVMLISSPPNNSLERTREG
jgi:hypothetical protein